MAIFFLLIGLELEREIYQGELSSFRNASLPIIGALGGMAIPAAIFLSLNWGTAGQAGAGIPMATDIAFAIGILSLLGKKVPASLKVFLTALAVIDDLGAIIVIAIFYTQSLNLMNLFIALGILGVLIGLNRLRINNLIPYLIGGVAMWYFMLHSGVHATITGVMLAFTIPFGDGKAKTPSHKVLHFLHKPVAFVILPLFALANTCIVLGNDWASGLTENSSWGIMLGLIVGKPLGITLFAFLGVLLGICALPSDMKWSNIIGAGMLGGIGFTMSIFITLLAFADVTIIDNSKIAILLASTISGLLGFIWLKISLSKKPVLK
jgi:NhaA family Na+:H+ antiporter